MKNVKPKSRLLKTSRDSSSSILKKILAQSLMFNVTSKLNRTTVRNKLKYLLIVALVFSFIPLPQSSTKELHINYTTSTESTALMELGESKVIEPGENGTKQVKYRYFKNIWEHIFSSESKTGNILESKTLKPPKEQRIAKGTKKYQYMLCSDGSYRYYTDEQYKDPKTGFTSKSEDSCAKNNQGTKVKLADTPSGDANGLTARTSLSLSSLPTDDSCRKENIIPYSTTYEDKPYLASGTTQIGIEGRDGFTYVCPNLKGTPYERSLFPPQNEIVYRGTGKTAQQIANEQAQAQQEQAQKDLLYKRNAQNAARTQCTQSLRALGMIQDEAWTECLRMYPYI